MIIGRKITVTQNKRFKVAKLELESQTVNELFKEMLEGMIKGNIEQPAVKIIEAIVILLKIKALPGLLTLDRIIVITPLKKAIAGTANNSGRCP
jgi:hypothetical protein